MAERVAGLVGQGAELGRRLRQARERSLPHALVLEGAFGTGRSTAALALARALLCTGSTPDRACGACAGCKRVQRLDDENPHPDLLWIGLRSDRSEIAVEQIRDLERELARHAFEGRARVVVISAGESLNDESQNALLKTLEEPAAATWLLLLTAKPDLLLPTVRSRCARLRLRPLADATLAALLAERGAADDAIRFVVPHAGGSLGLAERLLAPEYRELAQRIDAWLDGGPAQDPIEFAKLLGAGAGTKGEGAERVRVSFALLRSLLRARFAGALAAAGGPTYCAPAIERWVQRIELVFAAEADLAWRIPVEQTLTAMALRDGA
jgi:DNA polymerase-3 subunit delta'